MGKPLQRESLKCNIYVVNAMHVWWTDVGANPATVCHVVGQGTVFPEALSRMAACEVCAYSASSCDYVDTMTVQSLKPAL
jgi:hypothetical protein